jgi:hypothetical protein
LVAKQSRRGAAASPLRFILDSGAVIAESRGDGRLRALLRQALSEGDVLILPTIVVTETYRANAQDVNLNRLFKNVFVPDVDFEFAKVAGRLLAVTGTSNAPDAQVVAEALRRTPCTILTSDPQDISTLAGGREGITVVDVDKL